MFKVKGQPQFSYGGVVNPGCSPIAAGGGNWNVVDHAQGLHFQGQNITVTDCTGVPTKSPKVTVNVIDFTGTGILVGVGGNTAPKIPVCFTAEAIDNSEPGAGKRRVVCSPRVRLQHRRNSDAHQQRQRERAGRLPGGHQHRQFADPPERLR